METTSGDLLDLFLILILVISAYTDLSQRKIFNIVTFSAIVMGLVLNLLFFGWSGFLNSLLAFGVGFLVFLIIYVLGGLGGGDVKLIGAIGAIKGFPFILDAMFLSIFTGGIFALLVMVWNGVLRRSLKNIFRLIVTFLFPGFKAETLKKENSQKIPYGFCIALGTITALILNRYLQIRLFVY